MSNTIPFGYPKQAILIDVNKINTDKRSRQDYGDLKGFFDDIVEAGYLIHPPSVSQTTEGDYILIAGGRRLAAMQVGGLTEVPVVSFGDMPLSKIVELEGDENFKRMDMDWKERVFIIARAHELKQAEGVQNNESWGMRQTGALLGVSIASVSHAYQIREYLVKQDPEICDAPSLRIAYETLLKRRENEAVRLTQGFTGGATKVTGMGFVGTIDVDSLIDGDPGGIVLDDANPILDKTDFELSKLFIVGDSMKVLPTFNAASVDHIVTDIPYGIPLENMERIKNLDTVKDTHEVQQNIDMMLPFLKESYRLLKPNGYCVFWYDLDHHEKLHAWAKSVGFSAQRWPLVWHKLHPCINSAATKNFTKNVEFAMVLRKGNVVLNKAQASCLIPGDGQAERKLYDNPFAKPAVVWRFIYEAIAYKGQVVLDPFCGQMSSTRAAIDLGLTPMGIEIDEDHFYKGLNAIKKKLSEITNGKATFS